MSSDRVFTALLTSGGYYRIVADSPAAAERELARMGLDYVVVRPMAPIEVGEEICLPVVGAAGHIDYTTGAWRVELPGNSGISGHDLHPPVPPCSFTYRFSEPNPSEEDGVRSFMFRDDGVGNLYAHELVGKKS